MKTSTYEISLPLIGTDEKPIEGQALTNGYELKIQAGTLFLRQRVNGDTWGLQLDVCNPGFHTVSF